MKKHNMSVSLPIIVIKSRMKQPSGFTLIEILIVMVLLAMLTTAGFALYNGTQKRSHDSRKKHDLSQLSQALEMYLNDTGTFPAADANGAILACGAKTLSAPTACAWGEAFAKTGGSTTTYMAQLPKDSNPMYRYFYKPNFGPDNKTYKSYLLYAYIENAEDSDIRDYGNSAPICGLAKSVKCNYSFRSSNLTPIPAQ